jgi:hypothetical protein
MDSGYAGPVKEPSRSSGVALLRGGGKIKLYSLNL